MALPPPDDLGPYQATRLISGGAQSTVWLADGPHGEVAIKVARSDAATEAIRHEIALLRGAIGIGLVEVVDADPDGRWMAMERIRGQAIDQWADNRTDAEIVALFRELLARVERLHAAGIVHGDLKPANLMVDAAGQPRILDLGIATMVGDQRKGFRGTLGYAAPEVLQGDTPTPRSDLYGLGAVLYRCLAQRDPFEATDPSALAYLPMVSLPIPPATWRPGLSRRLEHVVLTLLARDPARRLASAARAAEALDGALDDEPARWILGMLDVREQLARSVVRAADGETRIVCLYGPPGSGRRTLIAEASQHARRLGLASLQLSELDDAFFKAAMTGARPVVVVARWRQRRALDVARAFQKAQVAGLVIFHHERPIPSLGEAALQLSPPPLEPADVARLARHMRADPELAEQAWARWGGHPAAVLAALRRSLPGFDPADTSHLPAESRQILEHILERGQCPTLALADTLRIDPHTLLDHCAVLFAEDRIEAVERGAALQAFGTGPADG
jgi:predicted Ser/Thr protein kinase